MITLHRLIVFTAFCIAAAAAYFSVTGIGKLFAGAAMSAMVMASALELGKLVSVSFLYRYWKIIPRALKTYMTAGSIVLIAITSAGIYGYLSSAYATVAATPLKMNADIQILDAQAKTLDEEIQRKTNRLDQIISLRGQQESRIDNLIAKSTTGSNTTIRTAQNSLRELDRTASALQQEINKTSAQRDSLRAKSLTTGVEINTNSDIGTFMYIANAIGVPLDTVVKWFILVIVLVFDPLSISLVLAYNFLKMQETKSVESKPIEDEKELPLYTPEPIAEKIELVEAEELTPDIPAVLDLPTEEVINKIDYNQIYNDPMPYYMNSKYDWNKDQRWETDPSAIAFKRYLDNKTI
jgi:hypothetical protein